MLRKAWVFVMVLAFSRRMVARIVFDQKIETWLRVHIEAFAELDGAPATIVPDNLKAAVIRICSGTRVTTRGCWPTRWRAARRSTSRTTRPSPTGSGRGAPRGACRGAPSVAPRPRFQDRMGR